MRLILIIVSLFFFELSSQTVHVISITESLDVVIAQDCQADLLQVEGVVGLIQNKTKYNTSLISIKTDNATSESVLDLLDDLSIEEDDLLILFYSGHGALFRENLPMAQILFLKNYSSIGLDRLLIHLSNYKAKFTLVLLDACQNYLPHRIESYFERKSEKITLGSKRMKSINTEYPLESLLDRSEGIVVMTSCSPKEKAYSTISGSFFTQEWIKNLMNVSSSQDWCDIYNKAKTSIDGILKPLDKEQTPMYYHEGSYADMIDSITTEYENILP